MTASPSLSPDLVSDVKQLFTFPFMVNALEAGTIVAVLAAVVGWYMVLRRQAFAGHTLSVMAFPGATAAALIGLPTALGYYLACAAAAFGIGSTSRRGSHGYRGETATIGTVQATGLAAGFLFLSLNHQVLGGPETLLFGTFLGVSRGQVVTLLAVAAAAILALAVCARPLLLATIDREVARAGGLPVRALDAAFLLILALAVAATSQITGALLVFALLVMPAAAAQRLTPHPARGLVLTVLLGWVVTWAGLIAAYYSPYPIGFYVTSFAFAIYLAAYAVTAVRRRAWQRPAPITTGVPA
jgi:zinc/manganese transport system permease protein